MQQQRRRISDLFKTMLDIPFIIFLYEHWNIRMVCPYFSFVYMCAWWERHGGRVVSENQASNFVTLEVMCDNIAVVVQPVIRVTFLLQFPLHAMRMLVFSGEMGLLVVDLSAI